MSLTFLPLIPAWLIVLVTIGLFALLAHGSRLLLSKKVPQRWVGYLAALRIVAILLFLVCLLRPVVTTSTTRQGGPDLMILVDGSASMAGDDGESRVAALTSSMQGSGLMDALDEKFSVQWFAFDRDARQIRGINDAHSLAVDGQSTRLAESLMTAWTYQQNRERAADDSAGAAKVIVLTDGNDQSTRDPVEVAQMLGLSLFPIAAPDVAAAVKEANVTIAGIESPQRVLLGSEARFDVTLRQNGADSVPLMVDLLENGDVVAQQPVTFDVGQSERYVRLAHRPMAVGAARYSVHVRPAENPEALGAVQPYDTTVDVLARNNKVLVLEDSWRWEFKFLRRVLEDDPSFTFTAFISRGPGIYMQFTEPDNTVKLAGFPRGKSELEWFDVIVMGDVKTQNWPQSLTAGVRQAVVEDGKSLVVIAGPGIGRIANDPILSTLLPVEVTPATAQPRQGPVKLTLTPEGLASPFFFTPRAADKPDRWTDLPDVDQIYVPLRKRPGATILAETADHKSDFGNAIVMAEHTVGKGRVLFVGTDTTWKWQTMGVADDEENTPYKVFWQQTLRAMAPTRSNEGNVNVWVRTDRSRYTAGETVKLTVEYKATDLSDKPEIKATVGVPDGRELPVVLTRDATRDNIFHASFEVSEAGHYSVAGMLQVAGRTIADRRTAVDVDDAAIETARLAADQTTIRRLASGTGGQVINLDDPTTWPTHNQADTATVLQSRTFDPWGSFYLLVGLVLVLAVDWLLRLLRGFV
jgi:hypothetical protein